MSNDPDNGNAEHGRDVQRPAPQMPDINAILGNNKPKGTGFRFPWKSVSAVVLIVILVAGGYIFWQRYPGIGQSAPRYATEDVARGGMTVTITATGSVEPTQRVDVSSELSGTVAEIFADYNSPVEAGEVLAKLETDELEADILSAQAKLSAAKADIAARSSDLEAARVAMERTQKLVERDVAPRQELEDDQFAYQAAQAAKESADASLSVAQSDLDRAKLMLTKASIRSPIDGVVLQRNIDVGQTVATSLEAPTLFVVAGDLKHMELLANVDEADVGKVKIGQEATFTAEAFPDVQFPATIKSIRFASEVNNDVVTYKAVLSVDNTDLLLRQGMTATATILADRIDNTLLVPNAALRFAPVGVDFAGDNGQAPQAAAMAETGSQDAGIGDDMPVPTGSTRTVYILRNGDPYPVRIVVGSTDGHYTQVIDGDLRVGDQVITGSDATSE